MSVFVNNRLKGTVSLLLDMSGSSGSVRLIALTLLLVSCILCGVKDLIALFLMREMGRGDASTWAPYIKVQLTHTHTHSYRYR